jgi:hypothetical protein
LPLPAAVIYKISSHFLKNSDLHSSYHLLLFAAAGKMFKFKPITVTAKEQKFYAKRLGFPEDNLFLSSPADDHKRR